MSAGVAPVAEVDGRTTGTGGRGPATQRPREPYPELIERECAV